MDQQDMNDDESIDKEGLDNTDFDGDPLNEAAVSMKLEVADDSGCGARGAAR